MTGESKRASERASVKARTQAEKKGETEESRQKQSAWNFALPGPHFAVRRSDGEEQGVFFCFSNYKAASQLKGRGEKASRECMPPPLFSFACEDRGERKRTRGKGGRRGGARTREDDGTDYGRTCLPPVPFAPLES